jgi:signal transduction histidine kinase/CheY-like chemotaxis protein
MRSADRDPQNRSEPQIFQAIVKRLRTSGAEVELPERGKAWLPAHELFPDFKPHDDFPARAKHLLGSTIEVTEIGTAIGSAETLVSHIRLKDDPWKLVSTWADGAVKVMRVIARTRFQAVGIIPPGIRAAVMLPIGQHRLPEPWDSFGLPLPGDEAAGYFHHANVDNNKRTVKLDFRGYVTSNLPITDELTTSPKKFTPPRQEVDRATSPTHTPFAELVRDTIGRALIVDDDATFVQALRFYLEYLGCSVADCASEEDARSLLAEPCDPFDLAIIDVHLKRTAGDMSGLRIASFLAEREPTCQLVLVSAEPLDIEALTTSTFSEVPVSGFVAKPFGTEELYSVLAAGTSVRPRRLGELLSTLASPRDDRQPPPSRHTYTDELDRACNLLRDTIGAEAVVLFALDPITWTVDVVAQSEPGISFRRAGHKLDRSPVKDVAIDGEEIFTGNAGLEVGKHFWLRRAHPYVSCVGVPVRLGAGTTYAHALFAFNRTCDFFTQRDLWTSQQTAQTIGHILKSKTLEEQVRQMKVFELMGKVYGSMAHDLGGAIPDAVLFDAIQLAIEGGNFAKAIELAEAGRLKSTQAQGIVNTFRDMARGQHDLASEFRVDDLVPRCVSAFEVEAARLGSVCKMTPYEGPTCVVRMRQSGLEQIVFNLLLNAAQQIDRLHTLRDGPGEILVELRSTDDPRTGRFAILLVHDNGPGIHKRDFDRVFDMHYTTKEDGCGLGLNICREIAESVIKGDRRGSLHVQRSILLAGTTFKLTLPL